MNCQSVLNSLCKGNLNKLIYAHLNINSIRNKFYCLSEQVKRNIDISFVSETKIDDSFPIWKFIINDFSPRYKLYYNCHCGDLRYLLGKIFLLIYLQ